MKICGMLCLLFFSTQAFAASGWSQTGTIVEVYNLGHTLHIRMSGEFVRYSETCPNNYYYALDNTDQDKFNALLSQILMAHAANKQVQFWINSDACSGSKSEMQSINTMKSFSS